MAKVCSRQGAAGRIHPSHQVERIGTVSHDTDKLIRQLSLVAFLMAERRPLTAREIKSVVEGYSEHVMDEIARAAIPDHETLRTAMDARRRSRSAPERIVERLLGFDLKLRQYEVGKRFCDAVAAAAGIEGLNRVWDSPEALPTPAELDAPEAWLDRVGPTPAAAA